jgi:hypothetical protein
LQAEAAKVEAQLKALQSKVQEAETKAEAAKKLACEGQFICVKGIMGF